MSKTEAAAAFLRTFRAVYAERMTAAAIVGGTDECLRQMEQARDFLVERVGYDKLRAANFVRAMHVAHCDDIGHAVPAEYRAGLIAALQKLAY